jgi:hypothetical protein
MEIEIKDVEIQCRNGMKWALSGFVAVLFMLLIAAPLSSAAQGRISTGNPTKPDSAKSAPQGNRLNAGNKTGNDTLKGGDGFVPRTVIDSFPRIEGVGRPPNSSVTRSQIDAAKRQIAAMRERIILGDSVVAIRRMDPQPEWPESRVEQLAQALALAKKQLLTAEKQLLGLEKRYDQALKAAEQPVFPTKSSNKPTSEPGNASTPPTTAPNTTGKQP